MDAAGRKPSADAARVDLGSVVPIVPRSAILSVIVDPDYVDSVLLWWILNQQPFRSARITCLLERVKRRGFPQRLQGDDCAIAVLNKKLSPPKPVVVSGNGTRAFTMPSEPLANRSIDVCHWADLILYSGYSLMGHPKDLPEGAPPSGALDREQAAEMMLRVRSRCEKERRPPALVTMSLSTIERLHTPLNQHTFQGVHIYENPFPAHAMSMFESGEVDFFLGAVAQRVELRKRGYVEIVHSGNDPFLFSIASLFSSSRTFREHRDLIHVVASLWYETVRKMRRSQTFRHDVATGIMELFDGPTAPLSYGVEAVREVFDDAVVAYEGGLEARPNRLVFFADRPAALVDPLLQHMVSAAREVSVREPHVTAQQLEDTFWNNLSLDSAINDATLMAANDEERTR